MKKILFLSINLIFSVALAQTDSTRSVTWILKTTPSYIFDFDNCVSLGAEYFVKKNKSFQFEGGYGNTNQNLLIGIENAGNSNDNAYRGFDVVRLRSEFRRYSRRNKNKAPDGFYNAIEVFFKYVGKESYTQIGRQSINFQPDFWEYDLVRRQRLVYGSHFKIGNQFYIFDDDLKRQSRWMMDIYVGVGFRHINNGYSYASKQPDDFISNTGGSFGKIFEQNGKLTVISGTLGFKLCYILR